MAAFDYARLQRDYTAFERSRGRSTEAAFDALQRQRNTIDQLTRENAVLGSELDLDRLSQKHAAPAMSVSLHDQRQYWWTRLPLLRNARTFRGLNS